MDESGELTDHRMCDGTRNFATLSASRDWYAVRDHVASLAGAAITAFVCDDLTEAWIDFRFRGHEFSINDQMGEYWFFVRDPNCDATILQAVAEHFRTLLG